MLPLIFLTIAQSVWVLGMPQRFNKISTNSPILPTLIYNVYYRFLVSPFNDDPGLIVMSQACNGHFLHMDFVRLQCPVCILVCPVGCVQVQLLQEEQEEEEAGWLWRLENTACGKSLPASQRPTLTSELHSTHRLSTAHTAHTARTAHTEHSLYKLHALHTLHSAHTAQTAH